VVYYLIEIIKAPTVKTRRNRAEKASGRKKSILEKARDQLRNVYDKEKNGINKCRS